MSADHEREFQRKFIGNITFYRQSSLYRSPVFLERNIRSFLLHHGHQNFKRQSNNVPQATMSSSSGHGHPSHSHYQTARSTWSLGELQQSLETGVRSSDAPVLRIDVTGIRDRKAIFRKVVLDEEPPSKRIRMTRVHAQCLLTIWASGSSKKGDLTYLVKQAQSCLLDACTKNTGERIATISMDSPFFVKLDELRVKGPKPLNGYGTQVYDMQLTIIPENAKDVWPPFDFLSPPPKLSQKMDPDGIVRFPMLLAQWRRLPQLPETDTEALLEAFAYQDTKRYKTKLSLKIQAAWSAPTSLLTKHNERHRLVASPAPHLPSPVSDEDPALPQISVKWTLCSKWDQIRPLDFEGYLCPLCNRTSFKHLEPYHFHLINSHDLFKFEVIARAGVTDDGQQKIDVDVLVDVKDTFRAKAASYLPDDREINWQPSPTIFDLEAFLKGDETWTEKKTKPPSHLTAPHLPSDAPRTMSGDLIPVELALFNESRPANEIPDVPDPDRKKFRVPPAPSDIRFFRLTVKRPLKEGELLSESDDDMDESWLVQKHNETIKSFTDMSQTEKQFIQKYDKHMLNENLSSNLHFREALIRFCRINRTWLQRKDMKTEFHKNAARLLMQGLISARLLRDCSEIIGSSSYDESKAEVMDTGGDESLRSASGRIPKTDYPAKQSESSSYEVTEDEKAHSLIDAVHNYGRCKCGRTIFKMQDSIRCTNIVSFMLPCIKQRLMRNRRNVQAQIIILAASA